MATNPSESSIDRHPSAAPTRIVGRYLPPLATGVVLLLAQVACSFFGALAFLGFDILGFGVVAALFARRGRRPWWLTAALIAGPSVLFTLFVVFVALGAEKLGDGVGSRWLLSLGLVPVSAIAGGYLATLFFGADQTRTHN